MSTLGTEWALAWMHKSAEAIAEHKDTLTDLDRAIGDADHGANLDRGFKAVIEALDAEQPADPQAVLKTTARVLISTVGGASGPLLGTAFLRAAKATPETIDGQAIAAMLQAALEGIQQRGKASEGEKTMVDAWAPAAQAAQATEGDAALVLSIAAGAAEAGAAATIPMRATKGRASYLGERSIGHKDPGAASSALILDAAAKAAE
ncbi:dihydroxyacetone kinase subunit DhaL [Corynebacterium pelargi]|uniref:PTS-dependent dihydroxyacetone kinase, ADP-binding subunit DhaL n=1 Tax=Corynebacterium pelargi TaxID=1471400 RepID=A0A410WBV0_9CORY|nr:dihydroxyacetone kinase subunit DhaL [Corynebacterium pelargi]QAU53431.1 PTS-dependent dihydroxyacetone kinase, ADP-binding subunit DhaL [Corynebacterium pelargi]GGG82068.1 dihydroxyacetone kinase subunit L [Corynebacterium pelargi]